MSWDSGVKGVESKLEEDWYVTGWEGKRYVRYYVFFFKQKTAYEMLRSLVGSEMCIRDRFLQVKLKQSPEKPLRAHSFRNILIQIAFQTYSDTVSYTHLTLPTIYSV